MKRLAILTVAMCLMNGAWSQVPRDGSQQEQNAQEQQKTADPSKPIVAIEAKSGTHKQEQGSEKPSEYPWRELYAPANVPNWFLALLAGIAGWLAYKTLKTIKHQADLMKEQSDLMVSKERAKLRFELDAFDPDIRYRNGYRIKGTISIFGNTEAFIEKTVFFAGIIGGDKREIEGLSVPMAEVPNVIRPSGSPLKTWTLLFRMNPVQLWVPTWNEEIGDVLRGESLMFCKGSIDYTDAFHGKWEFRFSRRYRVHLLPTGERAGGYWEDYGEPEDNGEYSADAERPKPN